MPQTVSTSTSGSKDAGPSRRKLADVLLGWKSVQQLLRTPLFYKLLLANAALIALAGVSTVLLTPTLLGAGEVTAVAAVSLFALLVFVLGSATNAYVIRTALSPLEALEETALKVQGGDYTVRAPLSVLADDDLERLIRLFNHVLDGVEAYRTRRRELSLRVLQAEERERERVAHELYAGTAQTLAGVLVRMRVANRIRDPSQAVAVLDEVRDEVAGALEEIRAMARQLRPPELDELGVRAALEAHARYLTEGRRITVAFRGRIPETCLSEDAGLALFRIVQEALSNAVLHSGGSTVQVSFLPSERGMVGEVLDDGQGFDPDRTLFSGSGGFGLLGMRERAGYVSGSLSVDSGPGEGTRVRVVIPWSAGGADVVDEDEEELPSEAFDATPSLWRFEEDTSTGTAGRSVEAPRFHA